MLLELLKYREPICGSLRVHLPQQLQEFLSCSAFNSPSPTPCAFNLPMLFLTPLAWSSLKSTILTNWITLIFSLLPWFDGMNMISAGWTPNIQYTDYLKYSFRGTEFNVQRHAALKYLTSMKHCGYLVVWWSVWRHLGGYTHFQRLDGSLPFQLYTLQRGPLAWI